MACWDLWQLEVELGVTQAEPLPEPAGLHDPLIDARYQVRIYDSLRRLKAGSKAEQRSGAQAERRSGL